MSAATVVKKLQRCERIGRDDYRVVKYKIKIKENCSSSSSSPTISCCSLPFTRRALAELTESLTHVAPTYAHNDSQETSFYSSKFHLQENYLLHPHHHKLSSSHQNDNSVSFASLSLKVETNTIQGLAQDSCSPKNIESECQLQAGDGEEDFWSCAGSQSPCKLLTNISLNAKTNVSLMLEQSEEELEGMWAMLPIEPMLQQAKYEEKKRAGEEDNKEMKKRAGEEGNKEMRGRIGGAPKSPWSTQEKKEDPAPWKLRQKEKKKKQGKLKEWEVKKVECECCGLEEEYTRGYEERVRGELCGHWLCGLCEEAVREERQRLGGRVGGEMSLQAALQAHMEPCRGFSSRVRAKACPPHSAVTVPHAVCRLLRRHLSTPSPSPRSRATSLPRSSSCLPSYDHHPSTTRRPT